MKSVQTRSELIIKDLTALMIKRALKPNCGGGITPDELIKFGIKRRSYEYSKALRNTLTWLSANNHYAEALSLKHIIKNLEPLVVERAVIKGIFQSSGENEIDLRSYCQGCIYYYAAKYRGEMPGSQASAHSILEGFMGLAKKNSIMFMHKIGYDDPQISIEILCNRLAKKYIYVASNNPLYWEKLIKLSIRFGSFLNNTAINAVTRFVKQDDNIFYTTLYLCEEYFNSTESKTFTQVMDSISKYNAQFNIYEAKRYFINDIIKWIDHDKIASNSDTFRDELCNKLIYTLEHRRFMGVILGYTWLRGYAEVFGNSSFTLLATTAIPGEVKKVTVPMDIAQYIASFIPPYQISRQTTSDIISKWCNL